MAVDKNTRLVNLVIALLATKRYLTKSQIYKAVSGYEGNDEAKDRMFERDKEELRALGVQIEMKSIDPFFDDELGYRIHPDRYKFDLGPLTPEEVTVLAVAAEAWRESALKDIANSTSIRLESLGIVSDFSELPLAPAIHNVPEQFSELLDALNLNRTIEIHYVNQSDEIELKRIEPLGIYSRNAKWYLYAIDTLKDDFRSYRLDRIEGSIKRLNKNFTPREFKLPDEHFPGIDVALEIRRDYAHELIAKSKIIEEMDEWILVHTHFESTVEAVSEILRYSPNVKVDEPSEIKDLIKEALAELIAIHE